MGHLTSSWQVGTEPLCANLLFFLLPNRIYSVVTEGNPLIISSGRSKHYNYR